MTTLKQAAQDVVDHSQLIVFEGCCNATMPADYIDELRSALQVEPEFNPTSLFKTADGHMSIDGYCVSFKDGNVVGVSAMTTSPSVDALIAEIDGLGTHHFPSHSDEYFVRQKKLNAIIDKYRSKL